jgi:aconitase B
MLEKVK